MKLNRKQVILYLIEYSNHLIYAQNSGIVVTQFLQLGLVLAKSKRFFVAYVERRILFNAQRGDCDFELFATFAKLFQMNLI